MKKVLSLLLILILLLGLAACNKKDTQQLGESGEIEIEGEIPEQQVVKIGVVGEDFRLWEPVVATMKGKGVHLEIITFSDYISPNQALLNGEIDLNAFQDTAFLEDFLKESEGKIEVIGKTYLSPMNIYSKKIGKLEELTDGAKVAIPSDPVNRGRALLNLQSAGLIELESGVGKTADLSNITGNPKSLDIMEMDAAQIGEWLGDVDIGLINGEFAFAAELEGSLWQEDDKKSGDYVNVIAARKGEGSSKTYKDIVKAYQSKEVERLYKTVFKDMYIKAW